MASATRVHLDTTITEEDNYGGMYWYEPGTCAQSALRASS